MTSMRKSTKRTGVFTETEHAALTLFVRYKNKFGEARLVGISEPGWLTANDLYVRPKAYERQLLRRLVLRGWLDSKPLNGSRHMYRLTDQAHSDLELHAELVQPAALDAD